MPSPPPANDAGGGEDVRFHELAVETVIYRKLEMLERAKAA